jgi:hypothetical protein
LAAVENSEYVPPDSTQELLRRYASGERRFPNVDLSDGDFSGVTLEGFYSMGRGSTVPTSRVQTCEGRASAYAT